MIDCAACAKTEGCPQTAGCAACAAGVGCAVGAGCAAVPTEPAVPADLLLAQVADAVRARATVYRLLASLYFAELTEEQIRHVASLDPFSLDGFDPLFAEGLHDVQRALRRPDSGTREELAVDYAHSILGAGTYEERRATPYESVFTSETGLLMQDARDEVLALFRSEHLQPDPRLRVPEDHLSFIFEFMAVMCDRLAGALGEGDLAEARRNVGVQKTLHAGHLLNWIDKFCDVFDKVALTRFYRGVSKMTRSFVHMDAEFLSDVDAALAEAEGE